MDERTKYKLYAINEKMGNHKYYYCFIKLKDN